MVAKTLEVQAATGQAGLTCSAYPIGTDTVAAEVSAAALTEATNRLGWYTCTADDLAAGDYQIKVLTSGGVLAATWFCRMESDAGTYQAHESLDVSTQQHDAIAYAMTVLVGALANAGTAAEAYSFTYNGVTYSVTYAGLDADGNRGVTVLSKA